MGKMAHGHVMKTWGWTECSAMVQLRSKAGTAAGADILEVGSPWWGMKSSGMFQNQEQGL